MNTTNYERSTREFQSFSFFPDFPDFPDFLYFCTFDDDNDDDGGVIVTIFQNQPILFSHLAKSTVLGEELHFTSCTL